MLQPGIRAWSPARRAAGGRGLRSPLPPTTPNPALGQPSLTRDPRAESVPLPPLCRTAAGVRTPAVPRKRGTSVRPASELPPLSGRRSPPRPAALTSANRIVVPALQAVRHPLLWNGENGFPLLSQSTVPERRSRRWGMLPADRSMGREKGLSAQRAGARRRVPRQDDGRGLVSFLFRRWLVASARHPGVVACAAGGRGQGLAQPLAPYDPVPRVGAAILDGSQESVSRPPSSSLPRGSGRSDSRCPAQARDERPSGVGDSAPFGAAISSAPCRAYINKAESLFPLCKRYVVPCCGVEKTAFLC